MEEKNYLVIEPVSSPCKKSTKTDLIKTIPFVSFHPILNGFIKTFKAIKDHNENINSEDETENAICSVSINTSICSPSNCFKLSKKN